MLIRATAWYLLLHLLIQVQVQASHIQGLIPIQDLTLKQPSLNITKICEINAYININRPDVIMLKETWLKKSVNDHEIIKDKNFSIFRNDRTQASHPSDPNNSNKFLKFGGGVLIAIRSYIQAEIKRLSVRKGAEILAIEVSIDSKKIVFCTIYRVENHDKPNHDSIMSTIKTFYKIRNHRKVFIVGDFNLKSISWPGLKIWLTETADIGFLLNLSMGLGLINVFQDLPTIKVELLT